MNVLQKPYQYTLVEPEPVVELTVVVPTFNEHDNVGALVTRLDRALVGIAWEVIFVDDDSTDGTSDVVREIARYDRRVRIIQRIGRRGLSSACVEGFLASAAPYLAVIDADLQHDEGLLPDMLRRLQSEPLDIVVASRYADSGRTENWDAHRLMISRTAVAIVQTLSRVPLKDPMSGFFMVTRQSVETAVRSLSQLGFKILFDLMASSPQPLRFVEVPYRFVGRQHGVSKLDSMAIWHFGVLILDKLIGRWIPARFIMFALVGGTGVAVHLSVLYPLLFSGSSFMTAQIAALITAMTSNFLLNNLITYRDQRLHGLALVRGLLAFYAACAVGALANAGIASAFFARWPVWWAAGLAGASIGAVWNYAASRIFTWRRAGLS
jgi:dolichol-phosphate mannosyltransferase